MKGKRNMEVINNNAPMSEDIRAIAGAFLLAKKEFVVTGLGGTNSHQRYKYAKIGDIYHAIEDALSNNNIIIWHFARPINGIEYLYTRLVHTITGQFIEDCRILESEKTGNQGKGAANTYMRKYALLSLCALTTQDDDGEEEERHINRQSSDHQISDNQLKSIQKDLTSSVNGLELYNHIKKVYRVNDISNLKSSSFESVKSYISDNRT